MVPFQRGPSEIDGESRGRSGPQPGDQYYIFATGVCVDGSGQFSVGGRCLSVGGDQWAVLVPNYVADGVDSGGDAGRHGACAVRVVCNPFRVGARAGEVPVTALRLPPAIFCQPCRLRRRDDNRT